MGSLKKSAPFLSRNTRNTLKQMGIKTLTEIQEKSIPYALKGANILGIANTGMGKTLAFIIPAVEMLQKKKKINNARVLIISPTRELAIQTSRVCMQMLNAVPGASVLLLIGGTRCIEETELAKKEVAVIVCTPGRLRYHINNGLCLRKIKMLILDEADRVLDKGFENDMTEIMKHIPSKRQTLMFSATSTENNLCEAWMQKEYKKIEVQIDNKVTVPNLNQSYLLCAEDKRFSLLFSLLKLLIQKKEKVIVFFSTCASTVYHGELFTLLKFNVGLLHSGVKQERRTKVFDSFCAGDIHILFCTDVAARGLDVPDIQWIIQYDPPIDSKEYIHRVGRTARAGCTGQALLFLLPHEKMFITYLESIGICIEEWAFAEPPDISRQFIKVVEGNYYLAESAKEALKAYLVAYTGSRLKKVFDVTKIELNKIARSFGFEKIPKIDIDIGRSKCHKKNN